MALLASIDTEQNKSKWFTEAAARIPEGVTGEARLEALGALALETWLVRPGKLSVRMLAWVRHAIAWARTLLAEKFGIETGKIGPAEIAVMVRRSLTQPAAQDEAQSLDDTPYFSFAGARVANLPAEAQAALEKAKAAYEAQDIDARKGSEDSLEVADAVTEAEDIRAETGWFKWVDGQWRYEINDFVSGPAIARADPSESFGQVLREKYGTRMLTHLTVKDLLRHPTLFAVYPELKDIPVQVYDGIGAALVTARRKIDFIEIGTENPIGRLHSTLLHELQHAIQSLEGHAHGTSTEAEARRLGVATALRQARERVEALRQKDQSDPTRGVDLMHASNEYRALKDRVYNQYHRTAGEVEARNTQARKDMTEKQRRETPPAATQDVADEDTAPGDLRFSDRPVVLGDDMTTAFSLLAQFDDAFQLPTPTKTTVADIAKEINPQLHVRELTPSEYGSAGARKGWAIDTPVGTSRSARGLLYERDGRVWINVAGLTAGEHSGNQIYAIAAGYAHNTKKVFMGDPEGLSPTGFYRRLENMISSALRYGTTDHLAPHESQRQPERFHPGAEYSGLGIKWKPGDTVHNLTEMMRASYNAALRQLPGIKDFTYDFDRQSFVDLRTDASVTRDGMRKAIRNVSPGASQSYTGGSATTARAVLYGTILRGKGTSDGPSALAGPGRQLSRGSLDPELDHIFYSERADEAAAEPTYTPGAEEEEIRQWVAKALGPKVKVAFEDLAGGKNAEWSRKDTEAVMKIATSALSPLSVAHFEAMRELFARLTKANSPLATTLARNFSKPYIQKALREHLPKDVWDSLDDIPTRIAYGFQLWAGGKRLFESSTLPLFRRIKAFIQTLLGIVTDSERIEHIFHAFGSGRLATESAVAAALKSDPVLAGRYTLDAETLLKATWNGLNALLATAQNTLTDSKIKEFQQIGHLLSKPTGTATNAANPESYLDAKARRSNEFYSAFYATFHKVTPEASDDAIKRWRGGAWKGNAIVEDMQRMMAKLYRYTNEAMGQSLDPNNPRFPRVWDPEAIRDNFAKFTKALQAAYEKATQKTLSATDAEELARALVYNPASEQFDQGGLKRALPVGVAKAGNPLWFLEDADFAAYIEPTLEGTMTANIAAAVRTAEYARRMGPKGEKLQALLNAGIARQVPGWEAALKAAVAALVARKSRLKLQGRTPQEIRDALRAEGYVDGQPTPYMVSRYLNDAARAKFAAFEPELNRATRAIAAIDGSLGANIDPRLRKTQATLLVYENWRLMVTSLFSQFIDPLGVIIRGGTLKDAWNTTQEAWNSAFAAWKGTPRQDAFALLAQRIGTTAPIAAIAGQSDAWTGGILGKQAKRWNDRLFRLNGVEGFAQGTRIGATMAAINFIKHHRELPEKHSARWLEELGLNPKEIRLIGEEKELDYNDERIKQAIFRWVEGAVLRPNAGMRPSWASDPHYALIFHFKQFTYAVQKVLLERIAHEARNGNFRPGLLMVLTFVPVMIGAGMLRSFMSNMGDTPDYREKWGPSDFLWDGVQRAGLLGVTQLGVDAATYGPGELLGPTYDHAHDLATGSNTEKELVGSLPGGSLLKQALY
ncbi:MAG: hypothetical protein LBC97_12185 [Bifidobacteriaceae bacterium]|nr:hypothetical protein [Bifidobacteriaceae bacterium]